MTQNQLILDWLKSGRSITALQALMWFNCFRLASRINQLKNQGHNIKVEMVYTAMSNKKVAKYSYNGEI